MQMLFCDSFLLLQTAAGDLVLSKPFVYQESAGSKKEVVSAYSIRAMEPAGFSLGAYDPTQPLVIDPGIEMATFAGGSGFDGIESVATDNDDDIWGLGNTRSADFPAPDGQASPALPGLGDVFIVEYTRGPDGGPANILSNLIIFGGSLIDSAAQIGVDADGLIYVMGSTISLDFPVSPDAAQGTYGGGHSDMFFTVFDPGGGLVLSPASSKATPTLVYSTYHGGAGNDSAARGYVGPVMPDSDMQCGAFIGQTDGITNYPLTTSPLQANLRGPTDATLTFYCKNPTKGSNTTFVNKFSSLWGGSLTEFPGDIGISSWTGEFCAFVYTDSPDLPTSDGAVQEELGDPRDGHVACFMPLTTSLSSPFRYQFGGGTYFGGLGDQFGARGDVIEFMPQEGPIKVYPVISINSNFDLPPVNIVNGQVFDGINPGGQTPFVAIFNPAMTHTLAALWAGGSGFEFQNSIDFNQPTQCLIWLGSTDSADFPQSPNALQPGFNGILEVYVTKHCADITALTGFDNPASIFTDGFESGDTMVWSSTVAGANGSRLTSDLQPKGSTMGGFVFGFDVTQTASGVDVFGGGEEILSSALSEKRSPGPANIPVTDNAPQPLPSGGGGDGLVIEAFVPLLRGRAILGSADFGNRQASGLSPQEIMTIFIARGGPPNLIGLTLDDDGRALSQLGPTRVLVNGEAVAMVSADLNQVSFIGPRNLPQKHNSVMIVVEVDDQLSNPVELPVAESNPALFALNSLGSGQGAILSGNLRVNGPENPSNSFIVVFGTGGGATDVPCPDGELAPAVEPFPRLTLPQRALVDGVEAELPYAGSAPDLVCGVNQWNVVPTNNPSGVVSIQVCSGDNCSQEGITAAFE